MYKERFYLYTQLEEHSKKSKKNLIYLFFILFVNKTELW